MNTIKFDKLTYVVKIEIDNTYVIYPHNYLKAEYDENGKINVKTIGAKKIILSFDKDKIIDVYYKDRFMDLVKYINKQL